MKKTLILSLFTLFYVQSYAQSVTFNTLLHILKEKDAKTYITSKPLSFTPYNGNYPLDRYVKNSNTPNVEMLEYEKKTPSVGYSTNNLTFMYALIKQIKYPLILKSDDPNSSLYYQFGDTHMMIMINIYKKKSYASLTMYNK